MDIIWFHNGVRLIDYGDGTVVVESTELITRADRGVATFGNDFTLIAQRWLESQGYKVLDKEQQNLRLETAIKRMRVL